MGRQCSPIITLTKIDHITLLAHRCDEMVIPQGIADEIQQGNHDVATGLTNSEKYPITNFKDTTSSPSRVQWIEP